MRQLAHNIVRNVLGLAAALCLSSRCIADEGMWTFDQFPFGNVARNYGVTLDRSWLDHVQAASVRLSVGCGAALVSSGGLVATARHCISPCVENLSSASHDYMHSMFLARKREDELKCEGYAADILLSINDVTERVRKGAAPDAIAAAACNGELDLHCETLDLFNGGAYKLYKYRRYDDLRLVFAPEFDIAEFGGTPDDFSFPHYALDAGFLRLYRDGKPAMTPEHLTWTAAPPKAGQLIFVSGSPTSTSRDFTVAQLEAQRDVRIPAVIAEVSELRGRMIRFEEESAENRRVITEPLSSVENTLKLVEDQQVVLDDGKLLEVHRAAEKELRARVSRDPNLARRIGDPWSEIAGAQEGFRAHYLRFRMLEGNAGSGSTLFRQAIKLVRAGAERKLASDKRLPEYSDENVSSLETSLTQNSPDSRELDTVFFEFWLAKTLEDLGSDDPIVRAMLGGHSPEEVATDAMKTTRLADPAYRKSLWDGGQAAIAASTDPLIQIARILDPAGRAIRKIWESQVTEPTDRAMKNIIVAKHAVYGGALYPNGNRTPRLSYGRIAGYVDSERDVKPFTTIDGLYRHATGADPLRLPESWLSARSVLDAAITLDFTSTADGAGGSSGGPVIDRDGNEIGIQFDGNLYAVGEEYGYDGSRARLIHVSSAAITEALRKVYGANELVAELLHEPAVDATAR